MIAMSLRDQLHRQIDNLPDDIGEQIADFALFIKDGKRRRDMKIGILANGENFL